MKEHQNDIWIGVEDKTRDAQFLAQVDSEFQHNNLAETLGQSDEAGFAPNRRDFLKLMGFGLGAATIAAGCEIPIKKVIPYVTKPDEIVPGVANYFASSYVQGGDYASILVKTREGRPIKIEGNSLSSISKGGTSARAQAVVLSLYDNKRIKAAGKISEGKVADMDWSNLDRDIKSKLGGGSIALVTGSVYSPSAKSAIAQFAARYAGQVRHVQIDPVSYAGLLKANEAVFGIKSVPGYSFEKANVIVSFGADFLGTWVSPAQFARQYTAGRKIETVKGAKMSRHYQVESGMTLTGSNADHRILVKPSEQGAAIAALYNELGGNLIGAPKLNEKAAATIKKVAKELLAAKGASLVVSGSNNFAEQVLVNKINSMLENYGATIDFGTANLTRRGDEAEMQSLINDMNSGKINSAIVWGANPAYELPNSDAFSAAFSKVKNRISFNPTMDETTALCEYSAPTHHLLESWGDAEPVSGHYSLIQPTITPLFKTRQAEESLLRWADDATLTGETPYYEYVKAFWQANMFGKQQDFQTFQAFWDMSLHNGVFEMPTLLIKTANNDVPVSASQLTQPSNAEVEISFFETVNVGNGQFSNNPWLMEMPDPVTRVSWGNTLSVPVDFDGINKINGWKELNDGDTVEIEVNGKKVTCAVVRGFGQMAGTVAIALGYGREKGGAGSGFGTNVNPLLGSKDGLTQYFGTANVTGKTGEDKDFACVQYHHTMGVKSFGKEENKVINADEKSLGYKGFQGSLTDRSVIFHANLSDLTNFTEELVEKRKEFQFLNDQTIYGGHQDQFTAGLHWGMHVDLNACVGCGACTVACMSENNVPVVGKHEVHRHHEMSWLRIDRYFYGDIENPSTVYQPMMCQHCDNAPCENVCPVAATNHSSEGLNQMTYNRCIGTRYCANNCPYKVRRFNWLDYTTSDLFPANEYPMFGDTEIPFYADNLTRMVLNPDVTVRTRGVIEKCSFCVQRLQEGKLVAKREQRALEDSDIKTACQSSCPTGAITFGNINNPKSEISKKRKNEINFIVIEEVNTKSNVQYTAKITNRDEEKVG
jgi:Fe-S-cluster-containing dehydrogenase component